MSIIKHVSDTRHDIRFNLSSFGAVINDQMYVVKNISLSGCSVALGDNLTSINTGGEILISLISSDFGEGNIIKVTCSIIDISFETGLLRLSFLDLSIAKKEILRYLLTSYKNLKHPSPNKIEELFKFDYLEKNKTLEKLTKVNNKEPHNLFFIAIFCITILLVVLKLFFFESNNSEAVFTAYNIKSVAISSSDSSKPLLKNSLVILEALVSSKKINELFVGESIDIKTEGSSEKIPSKIISIKYNINSRNNFVLVKIRPNKNLALSYIGKKAFIGL